MSVYFDFCFVKKWAAKKEVMGIIKATPIPAHNIVIISALNIFELAISPRE